MPRHLPSKKRLLPFLTVLAVIALVVSFAIVRQLREGEEEESGNAAQEMRDALEHNPGLSQRQIPLAYLSEKLAQSEGDGEEASGEILNGPAQEEYDNRAYPHTYIAPAQQLADANAYQQAAVRAATPQGQQELRLAQGLAKNDGWTELGPFNGFQAKESTYTGTPAIVSGRTTALAIESKKCTVTSCVMYAGTAGGGVWKTKNALAATPRWHSIGKDIPSTSIGCVYIAPNGDLYVGTGESNGSSDNEAGVGLYKSTNGGRSFAKVSTYVSFQDFTLGRGISSVAIDPQDPSHIYVGTAVARHGTASSTGGRFTPPNSAKVGLYESTDGGNSWTLSLQEDTDPVAPGNVNGADYFRGGISKIQFDPTHKGVVYASMFDYGLYRRAGDGKWVRIYSTRVPGNRATSSTNRIEFALAALSNGKTRIYLGDSTYYTQTTAGLLRTDDGTAKSPTWKELSNDKNGTPGYGSYNFCEGQCYYDMVISSPPGEPNEVFLSGSMNYPELMAFNDNKSGSSNGRAVVRSTDGGLHWTDMTNDAQPQPNGLHPDQHALAFVPGTHGDSFFTASDGGIVQQSGPYVDASGDCAKRHLDGARLTDCKQFLSAIPSMNNEINQGLATLQYQSVSLSPNGHIMQAGTQDNGTWQSDTSVGWEETVGGDGGQSAFNVDNPQIRYHSYYNPQHDVSFTGGDPSGWDWIGDPLVGSGEASSFYTPLTADPVVGGTVFDGLLHIWRTTDNGGDRAFLDEHCNELTGDFKGTCGDWVPLGGDHGDLSSTYWGEGQPSDNFVVAIDRAPSDSGTMWAGTRRGRLFITQNADAKNPDDVTYQRIDLTLGLPQRFISGIAIDPSNPDHVYVSYSGYSAYFPGGHVYDVTWNPAKQKGTAVDLSDDLGDQPITAIVYSPSTKALFVATDFGVLTKGLRGNSWVATQGLPKVAVYGLTLSPTDKELIAATHGRGIWELPVG